MAFQLKLGQPIRFLAIEWREHWEFDYPSLLLEPVVRYSPNGTDLETMVEDVAIDIAVAADLGKRVEDVHLATYEEFAWRGWDINRIRDCAEKVVRGKRVKLGTGYVGALERWFVFSLNKHNEVVFEEAVL